MLSEDGSMSLNDPRSSSSAPSVVEPSVVQSPPESTGPFGSAERAGEGARVRGSYWITTFGCQMNKADSERMEGILEAMGYTHGLDEHSADLVIYNTCTIRDSAEQKVYSYLGRQALRKRADPNLTLVVAGCVAQQEGKPCCGGCRNWIW